MRFEWANRAAEALGCDYEELNSATFKHHLRQILEQMTSGPQRQGLEDNEACSGTKQSRPHSLQRLCWWLRYMLSVSSRVHQDSLGELLCAQVPGWGMPVLGEKETVPPLLMLMVKQLSLAINHGGCRVLGGSSVLGEGTSGCAQRLMCFHCGLCLWSA